MATNNYNTIQTFKEAFGGGTRANRFEVVSSSGWPTGVAADFNNSKIKIFAASLPQAELGTISIPYRGRVLYLAGDRSYGSWIVSIYDDTGSNNLWKAFNKWKELLDGHTNHLVSNNDYSYKTLQTIWTVNQLDLNGGVLRTIDLVNCWPEQISNIDFDMGKPDFAVFSVSLKFDYFKISKGK
jgi:hypothetical protein